MSPRHQRLCGSLAGLALACGPGKATESAETTTAADTTTDLGVGHSAAATTADSAITTTTVPPDPTVAQVCVEVCQTDTDCRINGQDEDHICVDQRCVWPPGVCTDDAECRVRYSGWQPGCTAEADCQSFGMHCVDLGDQVGRCALGPDSVDCAMLGLGDVEAVTIEGQPILVCANITAECRGGMCLDPCMSDDDCIGLTGFPHCDLDSGFCHCVSDEGCTANEVPGWTTCHAGLCGCASDADCAGTANSDVCVGGQCGCSSVAACTTPPIFDGTTYACAFVPA